MYICIYLGDPKYVKFQPLFSNLPFTIWRQKILLSSVSWDIAVFATCNTSRSFWALPCPFVSPDGQELTRIQTPLGLLRHYLTNHVWDDYFGVPCQPATAFQFFTRANKPIQIQSPSAFQRHLLRHFLAVSCGEVQGAASMLPVGAWESDLQGFGAPVN